MEIGRKKLAVKTVRMLVVLVLVLAVGDFVVFSRHWTIVWDTSVMHYVHFLIDHGFRPYRDISDSNLPGTYLTDGWAMALFGRGDVAWRMYDFALCGAVIAAFAVLAAPVDWVAGLYGGAMFCLLHGSEGPNSAVEREQIMTALVAVGMAALFVAVRRRRPGLLVLFGWAIGMAASVKPTSLPLGAVVLAVGLWEMRRQHQRIFPAIGWTTLGLLFAGIAVAGFFLRTQSFFDFVTVMRTLLPSYLASRPQPLSHLVAMLFPRNVLLLLAFAVPAAALERRWGYEWWMIFGAAVFGAVSFVAQRKAFVYQRYLFVAFLFLLIGMLLLGALRTWAERADMAGWLLPALGAGGLLATFAVSVPHYLHEMRRSVPLSSLAFSQSLESDLRQLGPDHLQRNVECFDLTDGCFSALYHLDVVQANGFTGDLLLFVPTPDKTADRYRAEYRRDMAAHPPGVLVVSNDWFQVGHTFRKLDAWPEFAKDLRAHYALVQQRAFPVGAVGSGDDEPSSYRIYVRDDSQLLGRARSSFVRP